MRRTSCCAGRLLPRSGGGRLAWHLVGLGSCRALPSGGATARSAPRLGRLRSLLDLAVERGCPGWVKSAECRDALFLATRTPPSLGWSPDAPSSGRPGDVPPVRFASGWGTSSSAWGSQVLGSKFRTIGRTLCSLHMASPCASGSTALCFRWFTSVRTLVFGHLLAAPGPPLVCPLADWGRGEGTSVLSAFAATAGPRTSDSPWCWWLGGRPGTWTCCFAIGFAGRLVCGSGPW